VPLQPDDLLLIIVSAEDPEIAAPFNLRSISIEDAKADSIRLVDSNLINCI
jgi:polysaccharide export outer membrane protein